MGGGSKDSFLKIFRYLSKLREEDSFEYGHVKYEFDEKLNLFWLIRQSAGHRGFIILFNLNDEANQMSHISLDELTKNEVPSEIHVEYQWPKWNLIKSNGSSIKSDNLLIDPQSINIFSWKPKLIKENILFQI